MDDKGASSQAIESPLDGIERRTHARHVDWAAAYARRWIEDGYSEAEAVQVAVEAYRLGAVDFVTVLRRVRTKIRMVP